MLAVKSFLSVLRMNNVKQLKNEIAELTVQVEGPFPYQDCRLLLQQVRDEASGTKQGLKNLIPDLNAYFYLVDDHATGTKYVEMWDGGRLAQSRKLLNRSFFQVHTKYRTLEWRINQLNTPELYREMAVRDQLRLLMVAFIDHLLQQEREKNNTRQEQYLLSPA
jgi:hypothetical protein